MFYKNLLTVFTTIKDENIAYHVTEDSIQVDNAREQLSKKYQYNKSKLHYMDQIHSNIVKEADISRNPQECDALVTNKLDTPLMVMVADCIPVLFFDNNKKAIGVAHAGRNGTFLNIVSQTITKMQHIYNCNVKDIEVILGPSIQKCCYEVSQELSSIAMNSFGQEFVQDRYIDLQGINKKQLLDIGIEEQNIQISPICTKCSNENYFSYRKNKNCGRFAGIIMIS